MIPFVDISLATLQNPYPPHVLIELPVIAQTVDCLTAFSIQQLYC